MEVGGRSPFSQKLWARKRKWKRTSQQAPWACLSGDAFVVYFWQSRDKLKYMIYELKPGMGRGIGLRSWVEFVVLAERICTFSEMKKKRKFKN